MFRDGAIGPGGGQPLAGSAVIGSLRVIVGTVAITRPNAPSAPAVIGQPIYEGDQIDTGHDGIAVVLFVDGTVIQLDLGTRFSVAEFPISAEDTSDGALFRIIR